MSAELGAVTESAPSCSTMSSEEKSLRSMLAWKGDLGEDK